MGGGVVYLPQGAYKISGKLEVTSGGVSIIGAGQNVTRIITSSSYVSGDIIACNYTSFNQRSGSIRRISIQATSTRTSGAAIHFTNASNVTVEDVDMDKQFIGILIDGTGVIQFINRGYYTNFTAGGMGIWVNSPLTNDTFINHIIMDTSATSNPSYPLAGIRISASGAVWMDSCDFIHCRKGLLIDPSGSQAVTWCFFSNCAWDTCGEHGMFIVPVTGARVGGLNFVNCWSSSTELYDGCFIKGLVNGCEFIGCRFLVNAGNGLLIAGPAVNVHVDSCVASGHDTGSGFVATDNATAFAIRNCYSSGNYGGLIAPQQTGIAITSGCNNYIITGNYVVGNTSTGISDLGSSPKVVANNL